MKVLRRNGHRVGRLHFIKRDEYNTFTYNQYGFKLEHHGNTDLLWLSKIGYIELRLHRPISGEIKQVTVTGQAGRWYAVIAIEKHFEMPNPIHFKKAVGIDVGIKNYAYDSNNNVTPNPENLMLQRLNMDPHIVVILPVLSIEDYTDPLPIRLPLAGEFQLPFIVYLVILIFDCILNNTNQVFQL